MVVAGGTPDFEEIPGLRVRAEAGDRDAAGRLAELLARRGDAEEALDVWARAYGDREPAAKRLAGLHVQDGDLAGAVSVWMFSDSMWYNPAGLRAEAMRRLTPEEQMEEDDGPEDWAYIQAEALIVKLARRGDETSIAELRAMAEAGDHLAKKHLEGRA
ncbi:hypothetical protein [Actinomadura parmotrematis]|uniref:Sel1 repeat family protein n=1 Tax=Actinomadura parmotrematis TaxID=2864039 RepID=A0ABS7FS70_9ACTN|nr:hypothetical protein [Actinomadura parmotrematis]MBW8483244.1 hypothetical protein [Actinomadura parmotrematis]